jgi:hypothetical protein
MYVYRVDDQGWDETITPSEFDTQPLTNQETRAIGWSSNGWDYVDVENQFLADYSAGNAYTTIRLKHEWDDSLASSWVYNTAELRLGSDPLQFYRAFRSREATSNHPYLEVEYALENSGQGGQSASSDVIVQSSDPSILKPLEPPPETVGGLGEVSAEQTRDNFRIKLIAVWADEEWNRLCKELEPKWKEFQTLTSSIPLTVENSGALLRVEEPFVIRNTEVKFLPLDVEIRHVDQGPENDILLVKEIEVHHYGGCLKFEIGKELKPIGGELEELQSVEKAMKEVKDPEELRNLWQKKVELGARVKEGVLKFVPGIPAEHLRGVKPGDILLFPIIARLEHNGEEVVLQSTIAIYVSLPLDVQVRPPPS